MTVFETSEYKSRLDKTKQRMTDAGLEHLLVTDPANMNYLSGYDAWSFYVHQMLIVSVKTDEPIWVGRGIDAAGGRITTWLNDANVVAYPDAYVQSTERHPMDFIAGLLKDRGLDRGPIGVEMDSYYYTARAHAQLEAGLPNATLKDATNLVNWVRIIKSETELDLMRKAATIATSAMNAGIDAIKPGARESDAAAAILEAQVRGTEEYGGDYTSLVPLLPAGEKTGACHLTWTDNRYPEQETVIIELAGCHKRYHAPLARTVSLGEPPQRVKDTAEVVVEGINAALDAVRPGAHAEDVERAWRNVISQHGMEKESRIGYSVGLNYPPDWGEHTASLRPGDTTVLEPNMTFHMIPGMWYDDWGVELSETFRVTEDGVEVLSHYPRKLLVK